MVANTRAILFTLAFFASYLVPVTASQGNKPAVTVESAPTSSSKDLAADPPPVSEAAPAAAVTSGDSKPVESPVSAEKSAMETLLDRTWPVGQAATGADPASLTELAPGAFPTAAPVSTAGVSDVASPKNILVADEANVGVGQPRQSTLQRVYASLVGRKERMAKPEYGLNIQKRLPDPIHFASADEELVDAMRTPRVALLQKDRQSITTGQAAQDADANEGVSLMQLGALLSRGRSRKSGTKARHEEL